MLVNQPAGIGDILFIQPILWQMNHLLAIEDSLYPITEHLVGINTIKKSECKADLSAPNSEHLNLRWANQLFRNYDLNDHHDYENMMLDKYRLVNLDPMLWKTLKVNRNYERESVLIGTLNLKNKDFILINGHSRAGEIDVSINSKTKIIYMRPLNCFTVVDWMGVMELAKENHHVSTSTFFLFEILKLNTPTYIYPRPNEDGLRGISNLKPSFNYIACT